MLSATMLVTSYEIEIFCSSPFFDALWTVLIPKIAREVDRKGKSNKVKQ